MVGKALRQRALAAVVDPDPVSLVAAVGRGIPLINVNGYAGAPQPLRQTEAAKPGPNDRNAPQLPNLIPAHNFTIACSRLMPAD
jgi:hypothetical protein